MHKPCSFQLSIILSCILICAPINAQQSGPKNLTTSLSAQQVFKSSLSALTGNATVSDVTLTGSARRIAGSDDEVGSVTYKALANGWARFDFNYPSGQRLEICSSTDGDLAGVWSGSDGALHTIPYHNLLNLSSIFPALTLASVAADQNFIFTMVGLEAKNGASVYHLSVTKEFSTAALKPLEHLTQIDIFLDATTFLPVAMDYNVHPEENAGFDIPVELQFSSYQAVSGVQVPLHVQRFVNNSLSLDLQFQNASINSGVATSLFGIQ